MAISIFGNVFLTIDVGFRYIKITKVRLNNDELTILNYGIGNTPPACIKNGEIKSKKEIVAEISRVMKEKKLYARDAKMLISGTNIVSRIILIDKVDPSELDQKVSDEVKKVLPINVDQHRIDYKIVEEIIEDGVPKLKVFITAVSQKIISSYIQILNELKLKPISVDIPANSVSKFFSREVMLMEREGEFNRLRFNKKKSLDTFAVIDFGSETTVVNVLRNKIPEFNRVILRGSSDIDNEIVKKLNLGSNETAVAEGYKKSYGMIQHKSSVNELGWSCSEAIKEAMEKTVKEIKICLDFYIKRCGGNEIGRAYLIGGGSQLTGLKMFIEDRLNMPAYPVNVLNVDGIVFADNLDKKNVNFLINALGASL